MSLAYCEPWPNMSLGDMLKRKSGRASIIVGLSDRVEMVTGQEWHRLRGQAPRPIGICINLKLAHMLPWSKGATLLRAGHAGRVRQRDVI
ncbi:hypothetical protein [Sphingomonas mollis]|uniref:Uncharacterized protein n=1 Tax=Sphingomonas mollis TaxID=2795726 RepID=A0ABS0XNW2_9SPHN|nr:hypothetical protein [Sphingomonas sp. BT553]MBJ6121714.1 hypothetical protein [Sphingomonas sp. BT553]